MKLTTFDIPYSCTINEVIPFGDNVEMFLVTEQTLGRTLNRKKILIYNIVTGVKLYEIDHISNIVKCNDNIVNIKHKRLTTKFPKTVLINELEFIIFETKRDILRDGIQYTQYYVKKMTLNLVDDEIEELIIYERYITEPGKCVQLFANSSLIIDYCPTTKKSFLGCYTIDETGLVERTPGYNYYSSPCRGVIILYSDNYIKILNLLTKKEKIIPYKNFIEISRRMYGQIKLINCKGNFICIRNYKLIPQARRGMSKIMIAKKSTTILCIK